MVHEKDSKSLLFQSIGISIQKGNAACILGTKGIYGKLEELPVTTTIVDVQTRLALIYLSNFIYIIYPNSE